MAMASGVGRAKSGALHSSLALAHSLHTLQEYFPFDAQQSLVYLFRPGMPGLCALDCYGSMEYHAGIIFTEQLPAFRD